MLPGKKTLLLGNLNRGLRVFRQFCCWPGQGDHARPVLKSSSQNIVRMSPGLIDFSVVIPSLFVVVEVFERSLKQDVLF